MKRQKKNVKCLVKICYTHKNSVNNLGKNKQDKPFTRFKGLVYQLWILDSHGGSTLNFSSFQLYLSVMFSPIIAAREIQHLVASSHINILLLCI